jgi:hypothetical protein
MGAPGNGAAWDRTSSAVMASLGAAEDVDDKHDDEDHNQSAHTDVHQYPSLLSSQ